MESKDVGKPTTIAGLRASTLGCVDLGFKKPSGPFRKLSCLEGGGGKFKRRQHQTYLQQHEQYNLQRVRLKKLECPADARRNDDYFAKKVSLIVGEAKQQKQQTVLKQQRFEWSNAMRKLQNEELTLSNSVRATEDLIEGPWKHLMKGTEDPDKAKMKEREHPELPSTMASLIKLPAEEFADAVAGQVATVKAVCSRLLSSEEAGCPSFSAACCAPSRSHGRARGQGRGPPIGSRRAADMCGRGTPSVSSEICKMGSTRAETFDDDFSEACSENEKHSPEDALGTSHPLTRCQSLFASAWQWQDSLGDCLDVSEQHAEEQSRHCRLSLFSDPELRSLISSDAPQARRGVSSSSSACGSALEGEREEEDLSDAEENFVRRETISLGDARIVKEYSRGLSNLEKKFGEETASLMGQMVELRRQQRGDKETEEKEDTDAGVSVWGRKERESFAAVWFHFNGGGFGRGTREGDWGDEHAASERGGINSQEMRALFWQRLRLELPHVPREELRERDELYSAIRRTTDRRRSSFRMFRSARLRLLNKAREKWTKWATEEEGRRQRAVERSLQAQRNLSVHAELQAAREAFEAKEAERAETRKKKESEEAAEEARQMQRKQRHIAAIKRHSAEFKKRKAEEAEQEERTKKERLAEEEDAKKEQAILNEARVQRRKLIDDFKREEAEARRLEREAAEEERARRIERALEKFRVEAEEDPQRVFKATVAALGWQNDGTATRRLKGPFRAMNSFSADQLMRDRRFKLADALQAAGLFNSEAGRIALLAAEPPRPPRADQATSAMNALGAAFGSKLVV